MEDKKKTEEAARELKIIAEYLEGKHADLGKKKKDKTTEDNPQQLLQMINTVRRELALYKQQIQETKELEEANKTIHEFGISILEINKELESKVKEYLSDYLTYLDPDSQHFDSVSKFLKSKQ